MRMNHLCRLLSFTALIAAAGVLTSGQEVPSLEGTWQTVGAPPKLVLTQQGASLRGTINHPDGRSWAVEGTVSRDGTVLLNRAIPRRDLGRTPQSVFNQLLRVAGDPARPGFLRGKLRLQYDPAKNEMVGQFTTIHVEWNRRTLRLTTWRDDWHDITYRREQAPSDKPADDPGIPPERPPDIPTGETEEKPPICNIKREEGRGEQQGKTTLVLPILNDPLEPARIQEPPRNGAFAGFGVHLGDLSFTDRHLDLSVRSRAFDFAFLRIYRSSIAYDGPLGVWDFVYNKRLIEKVERGEKLGNDRFAEELPITSGNRFNPNARHAGNDVLYFDGEGRRYDYKFQGSNASNESQKPVVRTCLLVPGSEFTAFVSTYASPDGRFDQLQRFVILTGSNPFISGLDSVVFYMLRHKDGTLEIFNCHGRLRKLIDRNGNYMEFLYNGPYNPKTNTRVLSEIRDTAGRRYEVEQILLAGSPVPRIVRITVKAPPGDSVTKFKEKTLRFNYKPGSNPALLEEVVMPGGVKVRYDYQPGSALLARITNPREVARRGSAWLVNQYAGEKVQSQTFGDPIIEPPQRPGSNLPPRIARISGRGVYQFQPAGDTVTVIDPNKNRIRCKIKQLGDAAVAGEITHFDTVTQGKQYTTIFDHNSDYQITEIKRPKGNRIVMTYDTANEVLRPGDVGAETAEIREDKQKGVVRHNNLTKGNPKDTTHFPAPKNDGGSNQPIVASYEYESLFNQIKKLIDERKLETVYEYPINGSFSAWRLNGNPRFIRYPNLKRADGQLRRDIKEERDYNGFGLLNSVTDPGNHKTTIERDDLTGLPKLTRHPNNTSEKSTYDHWGNELTFTDARNTVSKFEYDARDRVDVAHRDFGPGRLNNKIDYEYDENDNLTRETLERKDNFAINAHASLVRLPKQNQELVRRYRYDLLNRRTDEYVEETGFLMRARFFYDGAGNLRRMESPLVGRLEYHYNERNLLTHVNRGSSRSVLSAEKFGYDENGNRITWEDGRKNTTRYLFDGFDRPIGYRDAAGNELIHVLDPAGNKTREKFSGHPGGPTPKADANPKILLSDVEFEIDEHEHVRMQTEHVLVAQNGRSRTTGSLITKFLYDEDDRLEDNIDPHGHKTNYEYDERHRQVKITDPMGNFTKWVLDGNGNIEEEHEFERMPRGLIGDEKTYITKRSFDALNRLISETDPLNRTSKFFYDSLDNMRAQVNRRGYATLFGWDALSRIKEERMEWERQEKQGENWTVKKSDLVTSYVYNYTDGAGVVTTRSPLGAMHQHTDAAGQTIKTVRPDGVIFEVLEYDGNGNPGRTKDANATVVVNEYDALNRLVKRSIPLQNRSRVKGVSQELYEYDGLGRLTAAGGSTLPVERLRGSGNSGYVGMNYDSLGRVVSEKQALAFKVTGGRLNPELPREVKTAYEDTDHLKVVQTYPSTMEGDPQPGALFQIERQADQLERVSTIRFGTGQTAGNIGYRYVGKDRVRVRTHSNGTETEYFYDGARRLSGVVHTSPQRRSLPFPTQGSDGLSQVFEEARLTIKTPFAAYLGERDAEGNLLKVENFVPLKDLADDSWRYESHAYRHDSLNRMELHTTLTQPLNQAQRTSPVESVLSLLVGPKPPTGTVFLQQHQHLNTGAQGLTEQTETFSPPSGPDGNLVQRQIAISRTPSTGAIRYDLIGVEAKESRVRRLPVVGTPLGITDPQPVPPEQFDYKFDGNGNLIDDTNNLYFYDYRNRLVRVESKQGRVRGGGQLEFTQSFAEFTYDPLDRMILRKEDEFFSQITLQRQWQEVWTWFIYSGEHCIEELILEGESRGESRYVWGARSGELVYLRRKPDIWHSAGNFRWKLLDDDGQEFFVHEDMEGKAEYFTRREATGLRAFEAGMTQRFPGSVYYSPSIGNHTTIPFPMAGLRYNGFFEGHIAAGRPLFNFDQPVDFKRRQQDMRAEELRALWELQWQAIGTMVAIGTAPLLVTEGVLAYQTGRLGLFLAREAADYATGGLYGYSRIAMGLGRMGMSRLAASRSRFFASRPILGEGMNPTPARRRMLERNVYAEEVLGRPGELKEWERIHRLVIEDLESSKHGKNALAHLSKLELIYVSGLTTMRRGKPLRASGLYIEGTRRIYIDMGDIGRDQLRYSKRIAASIVHEVEHALGGSEVTAFRKEALFLKTVLSERERLRDPLVAALREARDEVRFIKTQSRLMGEVIGQPDFWRVSLRYAEREPFRRLMGSGYTLEQFTRRPRAYWQGPGSP